jgi:hypothetical protein
VTAAPAWASDGDIAPRLFAAAALAALILFLVSAIVYLLNLALRRRSVQIDVRLLLLLWIVATSLVYCNFASAGQNRVENYVAWIEAHSGLRRPEGPLPPVYVVSIEALQALVSYARFGAYMDGRVYLSRSLPLEHQAVVTFHEVVHWMQPVGCVGHRELQAHRLTAAWARETGTSMPPIPWGQVYQQLRECAR